MVSHAGRLVTLSTSAHNRGTHAANHYQRGRSRSCRWLFEHWELCLRGTICHCPYLALLFIHRINAHWGTQAVLCILLCVDDEGPGVTSLPNTLECWVTHVRAAPFTPLIPRPFPASAATQPRRYSPAPALQVADLHPRVTRTDTSVD